MFMSCFIYFFCVFFHLCVCVRCLAGRRIILRTRATLWSPAVAEMLRCRRTEEFRRPNAELTNLHKCTQNIMPWLYQQSDFGSDCTVYAFLMFLLIIWMISFRFCNSLWWSLYSFQEHLVLFYGLRFLFLFFFKWKNKSFIFFWPWPHGNTCSKHAQNWGQFDWLGFSLLSLCFVFNNCSGNLEHCWI